MERHAPTVASERIASLDILRGFALFGVLFVNVELAFGTTLQRYHVEPHPFPGLANAIVDDVRALLFEGKFMSLFSMLFGVGLALQMERAAARGARFGLFAARRLGALLLLGVAHVALLWWGDILHVYAVGGVILLLFLRREPLTVFLWTCGLIALPVVGYAVVLLVLRRPPHVRTAEEVEELRAAIAENVRAYSTGGWVEVARYRLGDYVRQLPYRASDVPFALTSFLMGLSAWKAGVVREPSTHATTLKKALAIGLGLGLSLSVVRVVTAHMSADDPWARRVGTMVTPSSMVLTAMGYAAGFLLLLRSEAWRRRLAWLAYPGRMALSNYLAQSVICTFLFYGFGLGLYDRLGPAVGALVTIAVYAVQIPLSRLWLSRFRFGPAEWLWRCMTYGALQPMRLAQTG